MLILLILLIAKPKLATLATLAAMMPAKTTGKGKLSVSMRTWPLILLILLIDPIAPLGLAGLARLAKVRIAKNVGVPLDREAYEERAAIMEFDGGLSRDEAERKALATAIRAQELQAAGWSPWNAEVRARSEALPGWEDRP